MPRVQGWRRVAAVMAAAIMLATLVGGCAGPPEPSVNVMVVATDQEPIVSWDPGCAYSNEVVVLANVYETLTRYDAKRQEVVPLLATGWTKNADATEWIFTLRRNVKFHSGDPLDAGAVKFSLDRTIQLGEGASYIWSPIKEIQVVGPYTVKILTKFPAPVDLLCSAAYAAHIVNPRTAKHDWYEAGNADGTGPYRLESWTRGVEVVLAKNPDYWGGWGKSQVDQVTFKLVPEASARRRMVENGQADWVANLPYEDIAALRNNPKLAVVNTPSQLSLFVYLNTRKSPLDNKLIRQAISYAVPYRAIIETVYSGYAAQSRGIIPDGLWAYSDSVKQYATDLVKAGQLLTQAGYGPSSGKTLSLSLVYTAGDEAERRAAELLVSGLQDIGVELDPRGVPWDSGWAGAKSPDPAERQDMFMMYWWPDMPMPSGIRALFYTEKDPLFNLSYYANPAYDTLADEAERLSGIDRKQAKAKYAEAQNIVVDDAAAVFLCDLANLRVLNARLRGYVDNPFYPNVVFFYDLTVGGQ